MRVSFYSPAALARQKALERKNDAELAGRVGAEAVQEKNALFTKEMLSVPEDLTVPEIVRLPNEGLLPG